MFQVEIEVMTEDFVTIIDLPTIFFYIGSIIVFLFSVSLFNIVSFPNDPCAGGTKNGTCYTE